MSCDDGVGASESVLFSGAAPTRYERATSVVETTQVVIAPSPAETSAWDAQDGSVVAAVDEDETGLSGVGIGISRRVDELTAPDVLVDLDATVEWRDAPPMRRFRFLLLVLRRVTAAGGRVVCTLGEDVDPVRLETYADRFDSHVRVGSIRDQRPVGELSF